MRFWLGFLASFSFASFATAYTVSTLPSGALLSPLASPDSSFNQLNPHLTAYPNYTAGQAVNMALSPDGKTLLILTSGFNLLADAAGKKIPGALNEYVFVEDISGGNPVRARRCKFLTPISESPSRRTGSIFTFPAASMIVFMCLA